MARRSGAADLKLRRFHSTQFLPSTPRGVMPLPGATASEHRHLLEASDSRTTSMFCGMAIRNLVPVCEELTVIIPLWLSTILLTIGRPRPHPSRPWKTSGRRYAPFVHPEVPVAYLRPRLICRVLRLALFRLTVPSMGVSCKASSTRFSNILCSSS